MQLFKISSNLLHFHVNDIFAIFSRPYPPGSSEHPKIRLTSPRVFFIMLAIVGRIFRFSRQRLYEKKGGSIMSKKRFVSTALVFALFFVMLLSTIYIIAETEHDCVGDNCPVCSQISQCENTINTVSSAVSIAAVAAVFAYILMAGTVKITSQKPASTLISLKVQLTE